MSKRGSHKSLKYKGAVYREIPRKNTIRYKKGLYVLAQDPAAPAPAPAPAPIPGQDEADRLTTLQQDFPKFAQGILEHAISVLDAANLNPSSKPEIMAAEDDGVDVRVPIAAGNFAALGPTIVIDYLIDLPEEGTDVELSTSVEEAPGVFKKILLNLQNLANPPPLEVQEVIVNICDHNFAAAGTDIEKLLKAFAFLQGGKIELQPGPLGRLPKEEEGEDKQRTWLKEVFQDFFKKRMDQLAGERMHSRAEWSKLDKFIKMVNKAVAGGYVTKETGDTIQRILQIVAPDAGKFSELMKEAILEASQKAGPAPGRKATIENAVKELTQHEAYEGGVEISIEPKTNLIIAEIKAPYKFWYYFKPVPGGNVNLDHAAMEFCDTKWVANSIEDARTLISVDLELFFGYKHGVNPSYSRDSEQMQMMEMFKKLYTMESESEGAKPPPPQQPGSPPAAQPPVQPPTSQQTVGTPPA